MSKLTEVMKDNKPTVFIYLIVIFGIVFAAVMTDCNVAVKIDMISAGFGIVTWLLFYFLSQEIIDNKLFSISITYALLCFIPLLFINIIMLITNFSMIAFFSSLVPFFAVITYFLPLMWLRLGQFILKYRIPLLVLLIGSTVFMGMHASRVQLSYDFARAIPIDNPKYKAYQEFRNKFGEDGNLMVIGIQTDQLFEEKTFNAYADLQRSLKKANGVDDIISIPSAINLVKIPETEKLKADTIFPDRKLSQTEIDSAAALFLSLPFYKDLLYNPSTNAWLMGFMIVILKKIQMLKDFYL